MADSKKLSFSATPKSWPIVAKILQIGPWVSRIDWCPSHQSILLTQGRKILATIAQLLGVAEKLSFFESAILNFFFQKKIFFFCFLLMQISQDLWCTKDFSKVWGLAILKNVVFLSRPFWIFFFFFFFHVNKSKFIV